MDFKQIVSDLRLIMTLDQIAQKTGFASRGAVHDISTGRDGAGAAVTYERGVKLVALRKRKAPEIAAKRAELGL